MAKECLNGLMVESTLVNTMMTKSTEVESFSGQMEEIMKEAGRMESSMGTQYFPLLTERQKKESGSTASVNSGLIDNLILM